MPRLLGLVLRISVLLPSQWWWSWCFAYLPLSGMPVAVVVWAVHLLQLADRLREWWLWCCMSALAVTAGGVWGSVRRMCQPDHGKWVQNAHHGLRGMCSSIGLANERSWADLENHNFYLKPLPFSQTPNWNCWAELSAQIQGLGRCRKNRFLCTIMLINNLIFYPCWFLSPQCAGMSVLED